MIRPTPARAWTAPWIPGLGIVIALLVCVGLMVHVASIDADSTAAAASVAVLAEERAGVVLSDPAPGGAALHPGGITTDLCALLGDFAEGRELGVSGTPTFFLDGQLVEATSLDEFRGLVEAAVNR